MMKLDLYGLLDDEVSGETFFSRAWNAVAGFFRGAMGGAADGARAEYQEAKKEVIETIQDAHETMGFEPDQRASNFQDPVQISSADPEVVNLYGDTLAFKEFWELDAQGKGYVISRFVTRSSIKIAKEYAWNKAIWACKSFRWTKAVRWKNNLSNNRLLSKLNSGVCILAS